MEISQVHPLVFVAGDPIYSPDIRADLALIEEHVDVIIDLRSEADDEGWRDVATHKAFRKHALHDDARHKNSFTDFVDLLGVLEDAAEEFDKPIEELGVLVHCHMGVNRAPSAAMFLLLALHDRSPGEALTDIVKVRSVVGLAYAKLAVDAWVSLYEGEDSAFIKKEFAASFDTWFTRTQQMRMNKFISSCNRKYAHSAVRTDTHGNLHGTAR